MASALNFSEGRHDRSLHCLPLKDCSFYSIKFLSSRGVFVQMKTRNRPDLSLSPSASSVQLSKRAEPNLEGWFSKTRWTLLLPHNTGCKCHCFMLTGSISFFCLPSLSFLRVRKTHNVHELPIYYLYIHSNAESRFFVLSRSFGEGKRLFWGGPVAGGRGKIIKDQAIHSPYYVSHKCYYS